MSRNVRYHGQRNRGLVGGGSVTRVYGSQVVQAVPECPPQCRFGAVPVYDWGPGVGDGVISLAWYFAVEVYGYTPEAELIWPNLATWIAEFPLGAWTLTREDVENQCKAVYSDMLAAALTPDEVVPVRSVEEMAVRLDPDGEHVADDLRGRLWSLCEHYVNTLGMTREQIVEVLGDLLDWYAPPQQPEKARIQDSDLYPIGDLWGPGTY